MLWREQEEFPVRLEQKELALAHAIALSEEFPVRVDNGTLFAPQAQLEESANDRPSRRCSLVDILRGIRRSFWGNF